MLSTREHVEWLDSSRELSPTLAPPLCSLRISCRIASKKNQRNEHPQAVRRSAGSGNSASPPRGFVAKSDAGGLTKFVPPAIVHGKRNPFTTSRGHRKLGHSEFQDFFGLPGGRIQDSTPEAWAVGRIQTSLQNGRPRSTE